MEIGLLIFGLLILNATFIIETVFGAAFIGAEKVLVILSVAGLFLFVSYPYYMLAEAMNKISVRLFVRIITFGFTALLIFLFVRYFDIAGAAFGLVAGQCLFIMLLHYVTRKGNGGLRKLLVDSKIIMLGLVFFLLACFICALIPDKLLGSIVSSLIFFVGTISLSLAIRVSAFTNIIQLQYRKIVRKTI